MNSIAYNTWSVVSTIHIAPRPLATCEHAVLNEILLSLNAVGGDRGRGGLADKDLPKWMNALALLMSITVT